MLSFEPDRRTNGVLHGHHRAGGAGIVAFWGGAVNHIDPPSFWQDTMTGILLSDPRFWMGIVSFATISMLVTIVLIGFGVGS